MYEQLKLSNQLCFPLYAVSKEITRCYTPFLDKLDLTYPQYLAMLVLWENDAISVNQIGARLYLDSGTLTPLLKRLQAKGLVERTRSQTDERSVIIRLTEQGKALEAQAAQVPAQMANMLNLSEEEAATLHKIVAKLHR
ncbi:Transcriptional regulator, MarR [Bibersteinia trehalosi USDA-ARS-USMARC-188]|uniref:Transcriptional regulator, MarR n=4 Tax=Bibersteinia trehalosi TaxID=47735 RepID=A0A4V7ICP7_BIBTR|nr:MarR family transcriptional regulator [Bibersteinia trehalosi]AGH37434.1 Transcriptional regulator, MarR [Bibersteinia trehalosi USDA-ARS-USMARC-192]AHG82757.1 Transcriptional regulator, MarR [Bibersteinia trehalosi USDA-ARS-USMARC-188]AHG85093.1 Transcriptional regulator, MarR [Bibersteinia trehalosi USDA-ARS-USMARC-189]OAQ13892.1 MarR family transcriptional regulator [Bibersteinia trehalosi Y31]RRN05878.1 MarR family transcriptional regulator [Bibersteinia trehalosi]